MIVKKVAPASRSYGRGSDNTRTPAQYAIINERNERVGLIMGTSAGYMQKSRWEVCWLGVGGTMPRVVHYAKSFDDAKSWAEQWDGQAPERWRQS